MTSPLSWTGQSSLQVAKAINAYFESTKKSKDNTDAAVVQIGNYVVQRKNGEFNSTFCKSYVYLLLLQLSQRNLNKLEEYQAILQPIGQFSNKLLEVLPSERGHTKTNVARLKRLGYACLAIQKCLEADLTTVSDKANKLNEIHKYIRLALDKLKNQADQHCLIMAAESLSNFAQSMDIKNNIRKQTQWLTGAKSNVNRAIEFILKREDKLAKQKRHSEESNESTAMMEDANEMEDDDDGADMSASVYLKHVEILAPLFQALLTMIEAREWFLRNGTRYGSEKTIPVVAPVVEETKVTPPRAKSVYDKNLEALISKSKKFTPKRKIEEDTPVTSKSGRLLRKPKVVTSMPDEDEDDEKDEDYVPPAEEDEDEEQDDEPDEPEEQETQPEIKPRLSLSSPLPAAKRPKYDVLQDLKKFIDSKENAQHVSPFQIKPANVNNNNNSSTNNKDSAPPTVIDVDSSCDTSVAETVSSPTRIRIEKSSATGGDLNQVIAKELEAIAMRLRAGGEDTKKYQELVATMNTQAAAHKAEIKDMIKRHGEVVLNLHKEYSTKLQEHKNQTIQKTQALLKSGKTVTEKQTLINQLNNDCVDFKAEIERLKQAATQRETDFKAIYERLVA
jgi:hypothetical protein